MPAKPPASLRGTSVPKGFPLRPPGMPEAKGGHEQPGQNPWDPKNDRYTMKDSQVYKEMSIVAAFILYLKGPANNSAAFKKIAALCSQLVAAHFLRASNATATASSICSFSAVWYTPTLCL